LKELADFIKSSDVGLTKTVEEGDYQGLTECMANLFAVKERQANTDEMFDPLKQTIELLKTYDQELPEEVHLQLQVCCICRQEIKQKKGVSGCPTIPRILGPTIYKLYFKFF
jgi:hypothetical protein